MVALIALGVSLYYNYYMTQMNQRSRKKTKKAEKEIKMLNYNLQRAQQQLDVCIAEKRNGHNVVMQERTDRGTEETVVSNTVRETVGTGRRVNYIRPSENTRTILKRGVS